MKPSVIRKIHRELHRLEERLRNHSMFDNHEVLGDISDKQKYLYTMRMNLYICNELREIVERLEDEIAIKDDES